MSPVYSRAHTMFRAIYRKRCGTVRKMTFAAPDIFEARLIAADWQLSDDRLDEVLIVRELRPAPVQFNLSGV